MSKKHVQWLTDKEGDRELLHADVTRYYWRDWRRALKAYLADPHDFYTAEWFLYYHPANQRHGWGTPDSWWHENLDWFVTKVDPETDHIEDDKKRNTNTVVWVEWGPRMEHADERMVAPDGIPSHDPRVDTGGDTFEEAIVNLAHNVWKLYGANTDASNDATLSDEDRW